MNEERADMWNFAAENKGFYAQLLLRLTGLEDIPELEDDELDQVNAAGEADMLRGLPKNKDDC